MEFNENKELYDFDYVVSRIMEILDLDEGEIEIEKEIYGSRVLIEKFLKIHNKNKKFAIYLVGEVDSNYYSKFDKELRRDKELGFVAIKASSKNYENLDKGLRNNIEIAQEVIKSFVREGNNFTTIKNFIEKNFAKDNKNLWKFYEKYLEKLNITLKDDLVKNINFICGNNSEVLKLLLSKKIININGKNISINEIFINVFEESLDKLILTNKDFDLKSNDEKNIFYKDFLIKMFGLKSTKINKDILFIIDSILDINDKRLKKKLIKENLDKNDNNLNENIEDVNENNDFNKNEDDDINNEDLEKTDKFEDKLNLYLPNCSYSQSGLGKYHIHTSSNLSIEISASEKDDFTSLALLNFVKFNNILYKLGLDFIWNNYKDEFKGLLTYKNIGFNYLNGKGIDEDKVLEILNLIGKNIGLPGEQNINGDEEIKNSFIPFKTIGSAYSDFRKAKISSKINDKYVETNLVIGTAEKKLSDNGKINYSNGTFNLTKWK